MADPSETTQIHSRPPVPEDADRAELVNAIRELSAKVGSLQTEVQSLRAQSRALPAPSERAGWEDTRAAGGDNLLWLRALDSPSARAPAVPRLLLEIVFLVAVAVAAAIAELEVAGIAAVLGTAWALVALAEWTAARAERRRMEAIYASVPGVSGYPSDPTWFAPPRPTAALEEAPAEELAQPKLPPAETR